MVVISLNVASEVVNATIQHSPSAILNSAALAAARSSRFRTEVRNCRPIAADYLYVVTFAPPLAILGAPDRPEVTVTATGRAFGVPDSAAVTMVTRLEERDPLVAATHDRTAANAFARAPGIAAHEVVLRSYNLLYWSTKWPAGEEEPAIPPPLYLITRGDTISAPLGDLHAVVAAAVAREGVQSLSIEYSVHQPNPAYDKANAAAMDAAFDQAKRIAAGYGYVVAGPPRVGNTRLFGSSVAPVVKLRRGAPVTDSAIVQPPSTVEIKATVTATFPLKLQGGP
ncbi:MAG TPA: SIMPL domain-containing protein [Candidatus Elarobacter sp.]